MDFLLIVIVPFIIAQKILLGEICNLLNMFRLINEGVIQTFELLVLNIYLIRIYWIFVFFSTH